jgi:hypothetical protein
MKVRAISGYARLTHPEGALLAHPSFDTHPRQKLGILTSAQFIPNLKNRAHPGLNHIPSPV